MVVGVLGRDRKYGWEDGVRRRCNVQRKINLQIEAEMWKISFGLEKCTTGIFLEINFTD